MKIILNFFISISIICFTFIVINQFLDSKLYSNPEQENYQQNEVNCINNYKIKISLQEYEYFIYQAIPLNIEFEYTGNRIDSINLNSTNLSRNVTIKNSKGVIPKWEGIIDYPLYIKFVPGERKSFRVDLNSDFGLESFDTPNLPNSYFPTDVYSIQYIIQSLQLKSPEYLEKCKNNELVSSNIINFKIIEPTGINKDALERVKQIYKINIMGGKEADKYINFSSTFIKDFYNSVYINEIFIKQSTLRSSLNRYDELALEEAEIILNNYPNDIIARSAISQAYNYYKLNYNEERALQFLEEIKQTYRDLEAGKWAEHELQRIRGN